MPRTPDSLVRIRCSEFWMVIQPYPYRGTEPHVGKVSAGRVAGARRGGFVVGTTSHGPLNILAELGLADFDSKTIAIGEISAQRVFPKVKSPAICGWQHHRGNDCQRDRHVGAESILEHRRIVMPHFI